MGRRVHTQLHAAALVTMVSACSFDWDALDPRQAATGTSHAGGAGGVPGVGGGAMSGGGGAGGVGGEAGSGGTPRLPGEVVCHVITTDWTRAVAPHADGGFFVAGSFRDTIDLGGSPLVSAGDSDAYVARFGPDCQHIFSVRMGSGAMYEEANGIVATPDGGVVAGGQFGATSSFGTELHTAAGQRDYFAAKLSSDGAFEWVYTAGGAGAEWGRAVAVDPAGGVYFTGTFDTVFDTPSGTHTPVGDADIMVTRLSLAGDHVWTKTFGSAGTERARVVAVDSAGALVMAGGFESPALEIDGVMYPNMGSRDIFVLKIDSGGSVQWVRTMASTSSAVEYATGLALRPNNNIVISGRFNGTIDLGTGALVGAGKRDIFLAELDPDGQTMWSRSFGGAEDDRPGAVALDEAGNIALVGAFADDIDLGEGTIRGSEPESVFAVKYDASGELIWATTWGAAGSDYTRSTAVTIATDGAVIAAGNTEGSVDFGNGSELTPGYVVRLAP